MNERHEQRATPIDTDPFAGVVTRFARALGCTVALLSAVAAGCGSSRSAGTSAASRGGADAVQGNPTQDTDAGGRATGHDDAGVPAADATGGRTTKDGGSSEAPEGGLFEDASASPPTGQILGNDTPVPSGTSLEDWFGNTLGGPGNPTGNPANEPNVMHMQQYISAMFVEPDGTVLTNANWDEGGDEGALYKNDNLVTRLEYAGWGRAGEPAITANETYIFAAISQVGGIGNAGNPNGLANEPPAGSTWNCIERFTSSGVLAPFPTGLGASGAMAVINTNGAALTGLAADSEHLFVADPSDSQIVVLDATTMVQTASFPFPRPGPIAEAADGTLWIMQTAAAGSPATILHYQASGAALADAVTFDANMSPEGFALDGQGHLAVADDGPDQNIKLYSLANLGGAPSTPTGTFGAQGGLGALGGRIGSGRFLHPRAVGFDASGLLYVGSDETSVGQDALAAGRFSGVGGLLESYDLSTGIRSSAWPAALAGLLWLDVADMDPGSESDIYSGDKHFTYTYGRPQGAGWTWIGTTLDPIRFPDDPRLYEISGESVFARRIQGQLVLYMTDQYSNTLSMYRVDPDSETYVPAGFYSHGFTSPSSSWPPGAPLGDYLWVDANDDGQMTVDEYQSAPSSAPAVGGSWILSVDERGDIFTGTASGAILEIPCQGVDAKGVPLYDFSALQIAEAPSNVTELDRVEYEAASDTMVIGGYTTEAPHTGNEWGIVGTQLMVIEGWSAGNRAVTTTVTLPYTFNGSSTGTPTVFIKSEAVAGDYVFACESTSSIIHIYALATGEEVGQLTPDSSVNGSWNDMSVGLRAFRRHNGEYAILVEDDGSIRNVLYRWSPP